jgi:hypothetical protein
MSKIEPTELAEFLEGVEAQTVAAMKFFGPVWELANTETKVRLIFEDLIIRERENTMTQTTAL